MSYNEIDFSACSTLAEAERHFTDGKYYGEVLTGYLQQLRDVFDRYVRPDDEVAEFGVQKCVTSVLLLQRCKHLWSWEISKARKAQQKHAMALAGGRWTLTYGDSRKSDLPEVDVLFIDSDHVYECTKAELAHAAPKVRRYIIIHDTTLHWWVGHKGAQGIGQSVREFIDRGEWREVERLWPAPGVVVLGRTR